MPASNTKASRDRPNVVFVTAHDMGRELGCYGRQARTPTIDRLADDGVLFTEHFCPAPHCAPSRASLATGLMPHNHGMLGHPFDSEGSPTIFETPFKGWEIDQGIPTLAHYLRDRGYNTHMVGSPQSSQDRWGHEFIHQNDADPGGMPPAPRGAELVEEVVQTEAESDAPFYVELPTYNCHGTYWRPDSFALPESLEATYDRPGPADVDLSPYMDALPDHTEGYGWNITDGFAGDRERYAESNVRADFAGLYRSLYELDHAIGSMLDALEAAGERENTLFVFASDHGVDMVPRGKGQCYDNGTEASLLMHWPEGLDGGQRYEGLTSHVDMVPTILDLVDASPPYGLDGRSLGPVISGDEDPEDVRDAVFVEKTYFGPYDPVRGIRTEDYLLLRNFWPHQYIHSDRELTTEVELYDIDADPHQTTNVAADPTYADVRDRLTERLESRLEADGDPIITGPVPPQHGAFEVSLD